MSPLSTARRDVHAQAVVGERSGMHVHQSLSKGGGTCSRDLRRLSRLHFGHRRHLQHARAINAFATPPPTATSVWCRVRGTGHARLPARNRSASCRIRRDQSEGRRIDIRSRSDELRLLGVSPAHPVSMASSTGSTRVRRPTRISTTFRPRGKEHSAGVFEPRSGARGWTRIVTSSRPASCLRDFTTLHRAENGRGHPLPRRDASVEYQMYTRSTVSGMRSTRESILRRSFRSALRDPSRGMKLITAIVRTVQAR